VRRWTAVVLGAIVALYNVHVFWTMSLYRDGEVWTCDAADDNYFMMHVFEYLTTASPATTEEPIEMPFGLWIRVGPRNNILSRSRKRDSFWAFRLC